MSYADQMARRALDSRNSLDRRIKAGPTCERCPRKSDERYCLNCQYILAYTGPLPETVMEGLSQ